MFILILFMFTGCAKKETLDTKAALSMYISSDYTQYDRERLSEYFSDNVINDIETKYLPYVNTSGEFMTWEALADRTFSIGDIVEEQNTTTIYVTFDDEPYVYSYTMIVNDNKIISIERSWVS
jgi:predicted ester cyclase